MKYGQYKCEKAIQAEGTSVYAEWPVDRTGYFIK